MLLILTTAHQRMERSQHSCIDTYVVYQTKSWYYFWGLLQPRQSSNRKWPYSWDLLIRTRAAWDPQQWPALKYSSFSGLSRNMDYYLSNKEHWAVHDSQLLLLAAGFYIHFFCISKISCFFFVFVYNLHLYICYYLFVLVFVYIYIYILLLYIWLHLKNWNVFF